MEKCRNKHYVSFKLCTVFSSRTSTLLSPSVHPGCDSSLRPAQQPLSNRLEYQTHCPGVTALVSRGPVLPDTQTRAVMLALGCANEQPESASSRGKASPRGRNRTVGLALPVVPGVPWGSWNVHPWTRGPLPSANSSLPLPPGLCAARWPLPSLTVSCLATLASRPLRLLGTGTELKGLPATGPHGQTRTGQTLLPVRRLRPSWEHTPHGPVCVTGALRPCHLLSAQV